MHWSCQQPRRSLTEEILTAARKIISASLKGESYSLGESHKKIVDLLTVSPCHMMIPVLPEVP
eukprot:12405472-Ditylum_brightwellii.AAC.1